MEILILFLIGFATGWVAAKLVRKNKEFDEPPTGGSPKRRDNVR